MRYIDPKRIPDTVTSIDPETGEETIMRQDDVTVDIWMMRAFGYPGDNPSPRQYDFIQNEVRELAKDSGWRPEQVQAAIWVSAKARWEAAWPTIREEAKRLKEDTNDKKYRDMTLKKVREKTDISVEGAAFNFKDAILENQLAQLSWETIPGSSTSHFPEMNEAPYEQKVEFHHAMSKIFLDKKGRDALASRLGIPSPGDFEAPGVWLGDVSPGTQSQLVAVKGKGDSPEVSPGAKELINLYAAVRGIVLKQDAMGWHKPFFSGTKKIQDGMEVNIGRRFTEDEIKKIANAVQAAAQPVIEEVVVKLKSEIEQTTDEKKLNELNELLSEAEFLYYDPISSPVGARFLNRKSLVNYLPNEVFQGIIEKAVDSVKIEGVEHADLDRFAYDGDFLENDWKENPNGEIYISHSTKGQPDLQRRIHGIVREFQEKAESVEREFADRYGWTRNEGLNSTHRREPDSEEEVAEEAEAPAVEAQTEVGVKLTTRNRRLHRLRSSLPDKPIAGINEVRDIINKMSPALDVIHEEGKFYLIVGAQRIEIRITPHGLRMADGPYIGASIIPAGQSLIDESGNVIMGEKDLLAFSKVTSEAVDIKHDVVEWIMTNVLSNDEKSAIMDMFPSDPNRPDEPFHNVAEKYAQWTPGSPAGFWERIFSRIANFARAILSIPLTDEEKLKQIRSMIFRATWERDELQGPGEPGGAGGDPPIDEARIDDTRGGIFPSASEARKRRAPSERMPFLEDLRGAARVAGMGEDEIRANMANSGDAVNYLYGTVDGPSESGWILKNPTVRGLDDRKTRSFWGDSLGGANRFRGLSYVKDLGASLTSLRTKFHTMRADHIYRLITGGNDMALKANAGLLTLITGEIKMLDLMKIFRRSSKGRINATLGGRNHDYLIDTLLEVYRSSMDPHNLETMLNAKELVLADVSRATRKPVEIRADRGISQSEVNAIKDIIEGDADLKRLVEVDIKLKKREAELLGNAIERFIDRLADLGAKVRIGENNVRIAELTDDMRKDLQIDLKEIRSFIPRDNYYPNKLNIDRGLETREGKSFDLSDSGMIQWRQERPPHGQSVYLGSFSQHMLSRVNQVSRIYGQMIPIWEAKRFLNTKSVKDAVYKNLDKDFHDDILANLETYNGRSYTKGVADKFADWMIHLTTIQGLVAPVTMMKMYLSFPLGAGPLQNRGNMLKAMKYRITDESLSRMKSDAMYIMRYVYGYGGDPNIQESFHRMMAKSVLTIPPRGEKGSALERITRSHGLELLKIPDEKALTMLWKAAELDVKQFNPDLSGDQFWDAVSKKWREMVRMTQPISEKSEQGHLIANRRGLTRGLLFYGQRMQMFNQLARDWDDWRNATTDAGKADAYRNLRFSVFNIVFMNASLMALVGMTRMQMRDWSKSLWGDEDDEEPDDQSLMGIYMRGLRDQHLGMLPVVSEVSEIFLSPYRAARGPIVGDLKAEMVNVVGSVKRFEAAKEEYDESTTSAQESRAEERMGQAMRKLASSSSNVAFFLLGIPFRGLKQVGEVFSGTAGGIKEFFDEE